MGYVVEFKSPCGGARSLSAELNRYITKEAKRVDFCKKVKQKMEKGIPTIRIDFGVRAYAPRSYRFGRNVSTSSLGEECWLA